MADFIEATKTVSEELACTNCGAILKYKPGTRHLACDYCGTQMEIAAPTVNGKIEEQSLEDFLQQNFDLEEKIQVATVKCESCGATSTLAPNISADSCPFCASTLVVQSGTTSSVHKPQAVLPFGIDDKKALSSFKSWLQKLWFAPGDLKHYADRAEKLKAIYLPYWTFDCSTTTQYTGQRGEDYYTTETYTANENGKNVTRTRQVRKTRWYFASGSVQNGFDDLLIEATRSLPQEKLRSLEPWDIQNIVHYDDKYLSGFRTETYGVNVREGYQKAKERMEPEIRQTVCHDIGGDRQMIHALNTTYHQPTFKHVLLPVYVSAYRYNNKVYQFIVNARTGEVQGSRPYSAWKIALAIIVGIILGLLVAMLANQ